MGEVKDVNRALGHARSTAYARHLVDRRHIVDRDGVGRTHLLAGEALDALRAVDHLCLDGVNQHLACPEELHDMGCGAAAVDNAVPDVLGAEHGAGREDAGPVGGHGIQFRMLLRDETVLAQRDLEHPPELLRAMRREHRCAEDHEVVLVLDDLPEAHILGPQQDAGAARLDGRHLPVDESDAELLLSPGIELLESPARRAHVDVVDVDLHVRERLAQYDCLFGGVVAADLAAVGHPHLPRPRAGAQHEGDLLHPLAVGLPLEYHPRPALVYHQPLHLRRRDHVRQGCVVFVKS